MRDLSGSDPILQDLVDHRLETPTAEYKSWVSLADQKARAKIARHLCALANSGGGHLVFGFDDDGTPSEPHPEDLSGYSHDSLNSIVERYLDPVFHVAVHAVTAGSGRTYPVVRVPSHGAQPICSKRDGPHDKGEKPGIRGGVHYLRVPGPQSVPIDTPERWREVIHRCVVAERDTLLSSIGRLFEQPTQTAPTRDLYAMLDRLLADWAGIDASHWPANHTANRVAFGFRFTCGDGLAVGEITLPQLQKAIREASIKVAGEIDLGLPPFASGSHLKRRPTVEVFDGSEGFTCAEAGTKPDDTPALWQITTDGRGGDVNVFSEDSKHLQAYAQRDRPGRWPIGSKLSPFFQVQQVAQRLVFVRELANAFRDATDCELVVDYAGLASRKLEEPGPDRQVARFYGAGRGARRSPTSIPIELLSGDLASVAAALLAPILRLFDGFDVDADYVRHQLDLGG